MSARAHIPAFALALLGVVLASPSAAQDRAFDVPGGEVTAIYQLGFSPNAELRCRIRLTGINTHERWGPSFSVILSEVEDVFSPPGENGLVQLRIGLDEDGGSRTYYLITSRGEDSHRLAFFGTAGELTETTLVIGLRDDGVFGYSATEDDGSFGQGYALDPGILPKFAVVVASGLAGTVDCEMHDLSAEDADRP